ncbi:MAG: hypothetical protein WCP22_07170 [Chlamydiota bacterium]
MSTILKALKKAEDGRAKETLPGRIVTGEPPAPRGMGREMFKLSAALLLPALVAAAVFMHYESIAARVRAGTSASSAAKPSPPAAVSAPAPPAGGGGEEPALRLSGVIWDKENPIAIVNGKPITRGEELSGARVVKITIESVTFRRGGREFTRTVQE